MSQVPRRKSSNYKAAPGKRPDQGSDPKQRYIIRRKFPDPLRLPVTKADKNHSAFHIKIVSAAVNKLHDEQN
jgi:hypothetical protein